MSSRGWVDPGSRPNLHLKYVDGLIIDLYILVWINLALFSTVVPSCMFQDRNNHVLDGTTVENKGKLILTEIFPSVQKQDI